MHVVDHTEQMLHFPGDAALFESINPSESHLSHICKRLKRVVPTKCNIKLPASNKNTEFKWTKDENSGLIGIFPTANYENCRSAKPHELFERFFDDNILNHIIDQSGKYAIYCGKPNPNITIAELRTFIGILLISGYNNHSSVIRLWSQHDDLRNNLVYNSMRRDRFKEIMRFLHFEDNDKGGTRENPNQDKLWKLRPLTDHLKAKMIENFHPEQNLSFDESMIAYYGKHGCKQFIKGSIVMNFLKVL